MAGDDLHQIAHVRRAARPACQEGWRGLGALGWRGREWTLLLLLRIAARAGEAAGAIESAISSSPGAQSPRVAKRARGAEDTRSTVERTGAAQWTRRVQRSRSA